MPLLSWETGSGWYAPAGTAAFGLALVAYALAQSYREWRYLIGSVELAGAVLVTLGGLGGLRRRPG